MKVRKQVVFNNKIVYDKVLDNHSSIFDILKTVGIPQGGWLQDVTLGFQDYSDSKQKYYRRYDDVLRVSEELQ